MLASLPPTVEMFWGELLTSSHSPSVGSRRQGCGANAAPLLAHTPDGGRQATAWHMQGRSHMRGTAGVGREASPTTPPVRTAARPQQCPLACRICASLASGLRRCKHRRPASTINLFVSTASDWMCSCGCVSTISRGQPIINRLHKKKPSVPQVGNNWCAVQPATRPCTITESQITCPQNLIQPLTVTPLRF
jgi:hypothetical protein